MRPSRPTPDTASFFEPRRASYGTVERRRRGNATWARTLTSVMRGPQEGPTANARRYPLSPHPPANGCSRRLARGPVVTLSVRCLPWCQGPYGSARGAIAARLDLAPTGRLSHAGSPRSGGTSNSRPSSPWSPRFDPTKRTCRGSPGPPRQTRTSP